MKKLHKKAMLLIAAAVVAVLHPSCAEDGGFGDDLYFVTTNNIADCYFMPKTLNITTELDGTKLSDGIYGDWFADSHYWNPDEPSGDGSGTRPERAESYYFIDESNIKKYVDLSESFHREVLIDPSDIKSPFKEYAEYYGDTLYRFDHQTTKGEYCFCVLPVTGVDVTCRKDFDSQHPAGSNLNDIMCWVEYEDVFSALHKTDAKGNIVGKNDDWPVIDRRNYITLSSIAEHPLVMTDHNFSLLFNSHPSEPGTYEFTVKFTFGPDPLSGEVVDVPPAKVSINFAAD